LAEEFANKAAILDKKLRGKKLTDAEEITAGTARGRYLTEQAAKRMVDFHTGEFVMTDIGNNRMAMREVIRKMTPEEAKWRTLEKRMQRGEHLTPFERTLVEKGRATEKALEAGQKAKHAQAKADGLLGEVGKNTKKTAEQVEKIARDLQANLQAK
jgi:hypothetical protein